jgi:hypothetical protein
VSEDRSAGGRVSVVYVLVIFDNSKVSSVVFKQQSKKNDTKAVKRSKIEVLRVAKQTT